MVTIPFVKAMTPKEVSVNKLTEIPGFVIEAFNNLLKKKYHPRAASTLIYQGEVIKEMIKLAPYELKKSEIYEYRYLDIESVFTAQGWKVKYCYCPDANNTDEHYFEFLVG